MPYPGTPPGKGAVVQVQEAPPREAGSDSDPPSTGFPRRRRWRTAFAVVLILALVASGFLTRRVQNYRPLGFFGGLTQKYAGSSPNDPVNTTDVRTVSSRNFPDEFQVKYRPGGAITLRFHLTNSGSWPVKIHEVPRGLVYTDLDVRVAPPGGIDAAIAPMSNFRPFTLDAGESRFLEFEYGFGSCQALSNPPVDPNPASFDAGTSSSWSTQRVEYSIFGLRRHMDVPLPIGIAIIWGERGVTCGSREAP